jgi:hypothetical protein
MNPAHLHLAITHLPILGSVFGLLLFLLGWWQRSRDLGQAGLGTFVLTGLAAVPTYLTGRPASILLAHTMPGMSMDPGDQHAEIAIVALTAASVLAVVALFAILGYRRAKTLPFWLVALTLALALTTVATMAWTATLGGRIRHVEMQASEIPKYSNTQVPK